MASSKQKKRPDKKPRVIELSIEKLAVPLTIFGSTLLSTIALSVILIVGLNSINSNIKNNGVKGESDTVNTGDTADTGDGTADAEEPTSAKTSIDDDAVMGNRDKAKIAIVEFSDYECPFCKNFHDETLPKVIKDYIDTDKAIFVYRDLPLSFHEPMATKEAKATECVDKLAGDEKFFEFSSLIFANTGTNGEGISDSKLADLAAQVGVDKEKFNSCIASSEFDAEITKDSNAAQEAGINGTPAFVVGILDEDGNVDGQLVSGAQDYSVFKEAIEAQLKR